MDREEESRDVVIIIFVGFVSIFSIIMYNIVYYLFSSILSLLVPFGIPFLIYYLIQNKPDDKSLKSQFREDVNNMIWIDKLNAVSFIAKMIAKTVIIDFFICKLATVNLPVKKDTVYIGVVNRWFKI